jgi:hypothetical protein
MKCTIRNDEYTMNTGAINDNTMYKTDAYQSHVIGPVCADTYDCKKVKASASVKSN